MEWFNMEYNEPSRADYYAAQIAAEVRRSCAKNSNHVQDKHFIIKFKDPDEPKKDRPTREQLTRWAKARWAGLVGLTKKKPPCKKPK